MVSEARENVSFNENNTVVNDVQQYNVCHIYGPDFYKH